MIKPRFRLTVRHPTERVIANGHWLQRDDYAYFYDEHGSRLACMCQARCAFSDVSHITIVGWEWLRDNEYLRQNWRLDYLDSLPGVTDGPKPTPGPP